MKRRRGKLWALGLSLALLFGAAAWAQSAGAPLGAPVRIAQADVVYHGNVRSKKFHRPGCRYYNCKNCTARFPKREQAIQAGYVPCKVCKP
jgi:hypothetical protein